MDWKILNGETFKFQLTKSKFSFLLDLTFLVASLRLKKLCRHFKYILCPSFNRWNFVACIECINPLHSSINIIWCLVATCFKSTNKCCMNILFLVMFKTSLKMRSQIIFLGSSILWGARLILCVYCEIGMRIVQGRSMLFNPLFIVPLNKARSWQSSINILIWCLHMFPFYNWKHA
jgi:hypothetical protein